VRIAALSLLIIGGLLTTQGHAEDISTEPLTRADCDRGEMAWNERANVCIADSTDVFRQPLSRLDCDKAGMTWNDGANVCVADSLSQPLTRLNCDRAGMTWNDGANVCVADSLSQALTRLDCDRAGMIWNDGAIVCGAASQAAEAMPEPQDAQPQDAQPMSTPEVADTVGQPLTRPDCDRAGMTWNDTVNLCGEKSELPATQSGSKEANPVASTILINIDKAIQKMTVFLDGEQRYEWPVSTGLPGYTTPSGTYTASSMNEIWYSKQWDNAPMPHAVFFTKDGHAIHGTYDVKRLGKPASHGCVRISPENAATLYALVEKTGLKNTQVVLAGTTAGGEGKVATKTRAKSAHRQASRSSRQHRSYYADTFPQRPRGGGFFRRLFGGP
jgi:lipoprotein-anchoring transpeptidase ErfK/SrfK